MKSSCSLVLQHTTAPQYVIELYLVFQSRFVPVSYICLLHLSRASVSFVLSGRYFTSTCCFSARCLAIEIVSVAVELVEFVLVKRRGFLSFILEPLEVVANKCTFRYTLETLAIMIITRLYARPLRAVTRRNHGKSRQERQVRECPGTCCYLFSKDSDKGFVCL